MGRHSTSGYCLTCRTRRVKCGREQPACQRCIRSGHRCRGYESPTQLRMRHFGVATHANGRQQMVPLANLTGPGAVSIPTELDLGGFRENMAFTYFVERYAWAHFWMPLIETDGNNAAGLEYKSSLALVYGFFGVGNRDKGTEVQGLELRGDLIRQIRTVLERGRKDELVRMMRVVLILGMFTYAVDRDAQLEHHFGLSHILQYCGPEYFQDESLLQDFRACRRVLTCQAFAQHKHTFLESKEWQTIPFGTSLKLDSDHLLDILVEIPGIVEDLETQHGDSGMGRDLLAHKVGLLMERLKLWRFSWNGQSSTPSLLEHNLESHGGSITSLLNSPIEFDSPEQASDIFMYNAMMLFLMQLREALNLGEMRSGPLSEDDIGYIVDVQRQSASDLILPHDIKLSCQHLIEAIRILPVLRRYWTGSEAKDIGILAPTGIVYCAAQRETGLDASIEWETLLPTFNSFAVSDLQPYQISGI
ncbi:hypothetical protein B0I35DRAFT_440482 [Stachybotrys elegans]|uniref:Zn(2)-C6 fungal-type domain-containing protein n=1 Tax=Stachybotrys elegans TaxID=80388 RepID=A0A8K0SJG3_9HYPO|nr:hypothetical protein B0I35DRAFT_440482 [Stachybotrys elegans]